MRITIGCALACVVWLSSSALAEDLVLNGGSMSLAGIKRYDHVCLINGATLNVDTYAGDKALGGNLELIASTIYVDATSRINARGSGYQSALCSAGEGPNATAGGRGGCAVLDSAGGGAHFGRGGRGTVDDPLNMARAWQSGFPSAFEDDCNITFNGTTCALTTSPPIGQTDCDGNDGCRKFCWNGPLHAQNSTAHDPYTCTTPPCVGPSVAGTPFWHNIYQQEFGAAGGDKGCRDGDGRTGNPMGGDGGGRVVLVGLTGRLSQGGTAQAPVTCGSTRLTAGTVRIEGTIDANGKRGCGAGNDSGGGGAGGSVLIVGDDVTITANARISAAGGLGGDTRAGAMGQPNYTDCPSGAQTSGTCDDCGGGGGGGIISVLSVTRSLEAGPQAQFNVSGSNGGTCDICKGEAGGGAGELQLDGAYVGEFCDGFDNDFDGQVDEGLPGQSCGLGSCQKSIAACSGGVPVSCQPDVGSDASCKAQAENARPRVAVVVDTSASMLLDLAGNPTFGDGSLERPGISTTGDSAANDSRLFLATEALAQVISAYPEIDFALARYHQDQGLNRSCQTATWFECQGLVATYDDPRDNSGSVMCTLQLPNNPNLDIKQVPGPNATSRTECINYAGSCGAPRRGADLLSGFGTPVRDMVRWLDHKESSFNASSTPGDVCAHSAGHDCELRGSGPTPLSGSLLAVEDYVSPIRAVDAAASCRGYQVILVTDGAESCNGDPVGAAQHLHGLGVDVNVVAVSVLDSERASLNAIAAAGGTSTATFVTSPEQLVPALTAIIAGAIRSESCNGQDDDCDGKIDEDFPGLGSDCDDHKKGVCRATGKISCTSAHDGTECKITSPGQPSEAEKCNSFDDDCDGAVDEGLDCDKIVCTHAGAEICNGQDDDCDAKIDEADPAVGRACGGELGECRPGSLRCVLGSLRCIGETVPQAEQCNGKDDDCDGKVDDDAPCPDPTACVEGACRTPCGGSEFSCPVGLECVNTARGDFCLPRACALCKSTEHCVDQVCVDWCKDVVCEADQLCVRGSCRDCHAAGCPGGQVCYAGKCQTDACADVECKSNEFCFDGSCVRHCEDAYCGAGERCNAQGQCQADACAAISCPGKQACRGGQCADDPCQTMGCPFGEVCVSALGCVADPCAVTTCIDGTLCEAASDGTPRCVAPGTPKTQPPPSYVTSAGTGLTTCSVVAPGAAGGLGLWAWACVLGVLGFARSRTRPKLLLLAAVVAATALAGCKAPAICLNCRSADRGSPLASDAAVIDGGDPRLPGPDGGDDADGGAAGSAGRASSLTCTQLGDEVCNGLDDDCDRSVDEDFDFATNVRHCGGCDRPCVAEHAESQCEQGACKLTACLPGFADLDGALGCEYRCPVVPASAEDCNGVDDDCDGRIDEELKAPPGGQRCKHTAGTPCENVTVVCDTREQTTTWFCAYPASVDFDPRIADGIRADEQRCDGQDNDCDGAVDEPWPELGEPCDDGKIGACRDGGAMVCGSDQKSSVCDLKLAPDPLPGAGPDAPELCNDLDDNCDGIVDNSAANDPHRVQDEMVQLNNGGHIYYIYKYEASRPDASASTSGIVGTRSCSRAGVQPWSLVSYNVAAAACAVSGKRLCTGDEWQWACAGAGGASYPYATTYDANSCNGTDHDSVAGGALDNAPVATGSMSACKTSSDIYDLSGNVKEWVNQPGSGGSDIDVVRGGSFESPRLGLTCQTSLSQAVHSSVLPGLGFRCCSDAAP